METFWSEINSFGGKLPRESYYYQSTRLHGNTNSVETFKAKVPSTCRTVKIFTTALAGSLQEEVQSGAQPVQCMDTVNNVG